MLILSVEENNNKLQYKFSVEKYEGVVFNILVEYDVIEEDGESYFTCDYKELEHTKNNKKIIIKDSKFICDEFIKGIALDLVQKIDNKNNNVNGENSDN